MKKILIVASYMNIGGVEKSLISLLHSLPKDKYKITLLLAEKKGILLDQIPSHIKVDEILLSEKAIKYPQLKSKRMLIYHMKNIEILSFILLVTANLMFKLFKSDFIFSYYLFGKRKEDKSYDVAINYCGTSHINSIYIEKIIKTKKRYIWLHNEFTKANINPIKYKKRYERYDKIIGVSNNTVEDFIGYFPMFKEKTKVIYNIISHELIQYLSNEPTNCMDDFKGIKILSVGRLNNQKGFDLAIEVLDKLLKNNINVKWYVLGEGEERENLIKKIEELNISNNFILLGSDINPYKYIKKCDVYVQPSRFEGYAITLAEARLLYKPIITTNFAGANEQILNDINGIIVNFNEQELFLAIKRLIENEKLRKDFSNMLKKNCEDTSKEINKVIELLKD